MITRSMMSMKLYINHVCQYEEPAGPKLFTMIPSARCQSCRRWADDPVLTEDPADPEV